MSQGNATRGIEIGQESGQQPQIEVVATNVEIPIWYPIIPVIGYEERPNNTNPTTKSGTTSIRATKSGATKSGSTSIRATKSGATKSGTTSIQATKNGAAIVKPPQFEQPRMEPPRFKQPRMESPRMGQPQFGFPRMEPFQQGIGQPKAGFRFEPPQRPSQNRRNRFGYQNNDRQNYGRNDYDGHDRNAYNIPEREAFDRGIDLKERNIGIEPNPRLAQGQDLKDQILEVIDQALGPGHKRAPRYPYRKPYHERIDREEWPRGFKIPDFTMFSGDDEKTTIEHISRFTVQCGEYSNNGNGKLRLFPDSLTGQAFTWYAALLQTLLILGGNGRKIPVPLCQVKHRSFNGRFSSIKAKTR
uniref:Retrotransposon gag domain-containing protein n=1 Tax=Fagus sylvatica TaxID=28930 RepID=A0A2N9IV61_FAGSY